MTSRLLCWNSSLVGGGWSVTGFTVSLLVIFADISPIFTFCSGQFIASFIHLSKMLYAMLRIGVKVKV